MTRIASLIAADQGSAVIETAVSLMAILTVFFGIMEFCRAVYADLYVGYAAQAAGRYAMVRGSSWNGAACATNAAPSCTATNTDVTNFVKSLAPPGISTGTDLTVISAWPGKSALGASCNAASGNNSPGCVVNVQVTYNFRFVVPMVASKTLSLVSGSSVTISQ